jgi:hypothetical protein
MTRPTWVPAGTDLDKPNAARVYDYYLGGSHNFEVDRQMARRAMALWPELPVIMRANRAFLRRAVQFVAERGVTRFLDIGSGIPTFGAVHEIAREIAPEARVVYVDRDPVAVAHSRLLLTDDPLSQVVEADLRDPKDLLARPAVAELLRPGEPVAVLLVAVLHFVTDADDPEGLVRVTSLRLVPEVSVPPWPEFSRSPHASRKRSAGSRSPSSSDAGAGAEAFTTGAPPLPCLSSAQDAGPPPPGCPDATRRGRPLPARPGRTPRRSR